MRSTNSSRPQTNSSPRASGSGTVRSLQSGKYQARITEGLTAAGRQRQLSLGTFETRKAAEQTLRQYLTDRERGILKPPSELIVAELVGRSLDEARVTLAPKTYSNYSGVTRLHLIPALGHLRVQALTPGQLRRFYLDLVTKGLSRSILCQCRAVLGKALEEALQDELISRNVTTVVKLPACKPEGEGRALTPEETRRLFEAVGDHPLRTLFILKLVTGLRRGEICALNWQHLDLGRGCVHVIENLTVVDGQVRRGPTKTRNSARVLYLAPETIDLLRAHQRQQLAQGLPCGPLDSVFTTSRGTRPHPDTVSHLMKAAVDRAELGRARLHDLRTSYTSLARRAGVPLEEVSRSLGHADTRVTLQRYSKAYEAERQAHALGLNELLGPANLRLKNRSA